MGRQASFQRTSERPVRIVAKIDVLTAELLRDRASLQDDLLAVIRQRGLIAHMLLLAMTEDVLQSGATDAEAAMQVCGPRWHHGEAFVKSIDECREEVVASFDVADLRETQFLDQPVLQRMVRPFHTPLDLAGIRTLDVDGELCKGTTELRYALTTGSFAVHAEHRVPVGLNTTGQPWLSKLPLQYLEVRRRALSGNEAQLHQPARRVIDEDQQCAGLTALFEPTVLAPVDPDHLAVALAAEPGLVERRRC